MLSYDRLQQAISEIGGQRDRFGDATVETILAVLAERLAALPPQPAAEPGIALPEEQRKLVTVLFVTIDGFTRLSGASRNTDRLRQIDLVWQRLDEIILDYGGTVDKHMGDITMGLFGATVAREDDAERAVRCALALREAVASLGERPGIASRSDLATRMDRAVRIGINSGQVSLGQVGTDSGPTVIGDTVNVASRLKDASGAPGIYISQETYRLVRDAFQLEALGEISVKGRQAAVRVYRVVGSRPRAFFTDPVEIGGVPVPMIGRAEELLHLQESLRAAQHQKQGQLWTVVGEAGIGKSRLVSEFYRWVESMNPAVTTLQARTDQWQSGVSYSFIRSLLINHFDFNETDRLRSIENKILGRLDVGPDPSADGPREPDLRRKARAISRFIGIYHGKQAASRNAPSDPVEREEAVAYITSYLGALLQRSPLTVMLLDNIHWADEDSLNLLERVAGMSADAPFLMLCLARQSLFERRPDWPGEGSIPANRLDLLPLNEADSRELVVTVLQKLPQLPPALPDLIVRGASGNPFYMVELIRVLIEDGTIVPAEPAWRLRSREWTRLRVPPSLTGVLQARLDRLSEPERITLQQAAVIGDEFWDEAILHLNRSARFPLTPEQTATALRSLERRDMIYRASAILFTGSQAYLFRHTMLREVAYESVLLRDRINYHLQAARWLEDQSEARIRDFAALVARHYELAGRVSDASRLYEIAAGRAEEQYKMSDAIAYYRKVLDLLRPLPEYNDTRWAVKKRLGQALQRQGRLVEALEVYRLMQHSAELDGNLAASARAENGRADVLLQLGDPARAHAAAERAELLARLAGADLDLVWALLRRSEAKLRLGAPNEAGEIARQALGLATSIATPFEIVRALELINASSEGSKDGAGARVAIDRLAELAGEWLSEGARGEAAQALAALGRSYLAQDHLDVARSLFQRSLALRRELGDPAATAGVLHDLGLTACRAGHAAEAIRLLEEAAGLAETAGDRYLWLSCRLGIGEAMLARGKFPAAEATLRQVIAIAEDRQLLGNWVQLPHAYELLADLLSREGRRDEAAWLMARLRRPAHE